ncbi:MAG: transcriptional repressor LexA [Phycisphaerales bacterium]|nr:MAG: transcriptional repressor LexA [Phycisphaerales bacterium]
MPLKTANPEIQLTPRQLQLLIMVARFQQNRCYSPTLAELASALNLSRSTVYEHIAELRKKGLLSDSSNKARSLKASSEAQELLSSLADGADQIDTTESAAIPLAGTVAAGTPLEAVENAEFLSLSSCFGSGNDIFALEVRGDSMIGADIHEGDYVICRRQSTAHDGQLVVAIVDEENATLKRFYREKTRARLQPANDDYEPIYSYNCRIEAVVVGLVRKL